MRSTFLRQRREIFMFCDDLERELVGEESWHLLKYGPLGPPFDFAPNFHHIIMSLSSQLLVSNHPETYNKRS
jgi:hypothetical protein